MLPPTYKTPLVRHTTQQPSPTQGDTSNMITNSHKVIGSRSQA
jgi:hypothetical protein